VLVIRRVKMSIFRPWLQGENPGNEIPIPSTSREKPPSPMPSTSGQETPKKKKSVGIGTGSKTRKQTVKIVHSVKQFFRGVVQNNGSLPHKNINKLVSEATCISLTTVKKISKISDIDSYSTPTKKHVAKTKFAFDKVDDFSRDLLRRTVYEFFKRGEAPTGEKLANEMKRKTKGTEYEFPYCSRTLQKLLHTMGFSYKMIERRNTRSESRDVIAWRYRYLEKIKQFRLQGYQDFYLDETWYDTNTCKMKNWSDDSENCTVATSDKKGERIVIVHCGGRSGFIKDAAHIIHKKMADAPADYHGTMNSEIFENWFENCVLRRLEGPSVIVCDNAPYHSRVIDPKPNSSWNKPAIVQYMENHNIHVPSPIPIKPVLLEIVDQHGPREKKYAIDEMATSYGHILLRLPPYHCILNPIEMVWSQVKRKVASLNLKGRPINEIIEILRATFDTVTPEKWQNYIKKVKKTEDSYRGLQDVFDDRDSAQLVIEIGNSSSESESETSDTDME